MFDASSSSLMLAGTGHWIPRRMLPLREPVLGFALASLEPKKTLSDDRCSCPETKRTVDAINAFSTFPIEKTLG